MKKRTQIVKWLLIPQTVFVGPIWFLPILVGWWFLTKRRAWAWWMLVALYLFIGVRSGLPLHPTARHPMPLPWWYSLSLAAMICIPALCILLTDRPSGWPPSDVPNEAIGRSLKKRTRVTAWIFFYLLAWGVLGSALSFLEQHAIGGKAISDGPFRIVVSLWFFALLPFWIGLLYERKWAWQGLCMLYAVMVPLGLWYPVQAPAFLAAHPKIHMSVYAYVAMIVATVLLGYGLPIWILLTDRPSGWANPQSEIRDPQ